MTHESQSSGRKYVLEIIEAYFNDSENDESGLVVIFDTLYAWNEQNTGYKNLKETLTDDQTKRLVIIRDVSSQGELMRSIVSLKDPDVSPLGHLSELPISLIIIDNISIFIWKTVLSDTVIKEYTSLGALIKRTQRALGCSIITISWDNKFTVLPLKNGTMSNQAKPTIPSQYFQTIDHSYAIINRNQRTDQVLVKYEATKSGQESTFTDTIT